MTAVIVVVSLVVLVGVIIWASLEEQKRALAHLGALASRQGLEVVVPDKSSWSATPVVEGRQAGRRVRFWSFTTGGGKSQRHWVAAGAEPRDVGQFAFRIEPQGLATRLAEWFGAKEITVGEARFDAAWFVRTTAPEALGAALLPEIRAKLMAAREGGAGGEFKLEEGWVCYVEQGRFANDATTRKLESLVPLLHDLADIAEVCAGPGR